MRRVQHLLVELIGETVRELWKKLPNPFVFSATFSDLAGMSIPPLIPPLFKRFYRQQGRAVAANVLIDLLRDLLGF